MLLTKRYRNVIAFMLIQAVVFVLYNVRLHFYYENRITDNTFQWLPGEQLDNTTIQVNSTEADIRTHHVALDNSRLSVTSDMNDTGSVQNVTSNWNLITDNKSTDEQYSTRNMLSSSANSVTGIYLDNTTSNLRHSENKTMSKVNTSNLYAVGETLSFSPPNDMSLECLESFLKRYSNYCNAAIVPFSLEKENASALCPCIPHTLIGPYEVSFVQTTFTQTEAEHPELLPGGHWAPTSCIARQRIAIIVPFRDRESHLKVFLRILHPFLQRQLVDYTIFVVEQERPAIFNKASLMNAGFLELRSRYQIDCFIFHDVDMLPEDDRNFYGCYKSPRHVGAYVDKHKYNLLYADIFGGATAFTEKQFLTLNGYSNEFYGWGGEDDDMFNRIKWTHLNFLRFPKCVARYKMIKHQRDKSNPYIASLANRAWKMRPQVYKKNGLNSLSYRFVRLEKKALFTRILIALDDPPTSEQRPTTTTNSTS